MSDDKIVSSDLAPELSEFNRSARYTIREMVDGEFVFDLVVSLGVVALLNEVAKSVYSILYRGDKVWHYFELIVCGSIVLFSIAFAMDVVSKVYQKAINQRSGSRIDLATESLTWWPGAPPEAKETIALAEIQTVQLIGVNNVHSLRSFDASERRLNFSERNVNDPEAWAKALIARFPHIRLERDQCSASPRRPAGWAS